MRAHPGLRKDGVRGALTVLQLQPFDAIGSVSLIIKAFGGKPAYLGAIRELERGLYQQPAN